MSRDWEEIFRQWSQPSSNTESDKAKNAECMIKNAITNNTALSQHKVNVFVQGSYKNNTNVREDSDVDICVCCTELIYADYSIAPNMNDSKAQLVPATYSYIQFKNDLEQALIDKFGSSGVRRGKKAFDVHANTYRIDADVVPAMMRRLYSEDGSYREGIQIRSGDNMRINNWPKQHNKNGITKNNRTNKRFKFIVRSIKRLRNFLEKNNVVSATPIPSFLIECLVYLVPDDCFKGDSYKTNVVNCLSYLMKGTLTDDTCKTWAEINGIKYLFWKGQSWNRQKVNQFLNCAYNYII